MRNTNSDHRRIILVTTMFDHGGVVSYWKDVINLAGERTWMVFTNRVDGVDPDPFRVSNVSVDLGFQWTSPLRASLNLIKLEREFKPQTVTFNATLAVVKLLPAILYFRLFRKPLLLTCVFHNGAIYKSGWKNFLNLWLVSLAALFIHQNIFVSGFVQNYWRVHGRVLPRPFAAKAKSGFDAETVARRLRIGFLGRLSHEKDPELFLKVAERLREKVDAEVELAGLGPLREELATAYPWARFPGWVASKEWLPTIDILLTTSRTEGWPFALGEALELGVPTIGVDVGGVGELLGPSRTKWLLRSRDPELLSNLVLEFVRQFPKHYSEYFRPQASEGVMNPETWARSTIEPWV